MHVYMNSYTYMYISSRGFKLLKFALFLGLNILWSCRFASVVLPPARTLWHLCVIVIVAPGTGFDSWRRDVSHRLVAPVAILAQAILAQGVK